MEIQQDKSKAPRQLALMEEIMTSTIWLLSSPFAREHFSRGKVEGKAEGKALSR
ncbi:hypothetical protein ACQEVF_23710 [Nonomuraea polychroma]|uniref:hypothetical protein n=1 Tax=Nonomuraea polychroma TaxID=46176 RepID=UPI003D8B3660